MGHCFDALAKTVRRLFVGRIAMTGRYNNIMGKYEIDDFLAANFWCQGYHFNNVLAIIQQLFCLLYCRRMYQLLYMGASPCFIYPGAFDVKTEDTLSFFTPVILYRIDTFIKYVVGIRRYGWEAKSRATFITIFV